MLGKGCLLSTMPSNLSGDEDSAAEDMSKTENTKLADDEEVTKFVEWDPSGRFGRVSSSPSPLVDPASAPPKFFILFIFVLFYFLLPLSPPLIFLSLPK